MQLLVLPSQRVLLYEVAKNSLSLLPFKCEDYAVCQPYIAMHHYKTVQIFKCNDFSKPIMEETYLKKVQTTELATMQKGEYECVASDKFGDMYRISLTPESEGQVSIHKEYMNSNLGIPRYLKTLQYKDHRYYVLGDEEKRVKVYNAKEVHELLTVWHMLNRHSVDIFEMKGQETNEDSIVLLLTKFFDKNTLEEDVDFHWLKKSELEEIEYPGRPISKQSKYDKQNCKYFSALDNQSTNGAKSIILFFLFEDHLQYELFHENQESKQTSPYSSVRVGSVPINKGKWDYLQAVILDDGKRVAVAYGTQVDTAAELSSDSWELVANIALNQYENVTFIEL